ncbi:MAG: hypothetical protein QOF62_326 [Pyrinomonadaceae bacterium]|jgi:hypothetical protein|nr:hypothetical protein [Pyrinomonadaceae bacterium]
MLSVMLSTLNSMIVNQNNICWRPDWYRPYESLWSLLKKVAYLNAASYADIQQLVGRVKSERNSPRGEKLRCDLNSFAAVDNEKLKNLLLIDSTALLQTTALAYIKHEELIVLTSNQLRYCTDCLKVGFHSAIHQLLFLSQCPIHNSPLVTRCPECGTLAPRYTVASVTARRRTNCDNCFESFAEKFRLRIAACLSHDSQSRELAELGSWLNQRLSAGWTEYYAFTATFFRKPSKCRSTKLLRLPGYWSRALPFSSKALVQLPERESHNSLSIPGQVGLTETLANEYGQLDPDFEKDLQSDFRSIKRNLFRRVLRPHKQCIRRLQKHVCWIIPGRYWRGTICVAANAYLLWLMRCQNTNDPTNVFRSQKLRVSPIETHSGTQGPLSRSAVRRIVALNWTSLFYEALLVAFGLNRKGLYSLCPALVQGVRRPHWLVERSKDEVQPSTGGCAIVTSIESF